jgi:hypothetical protein
VVQVASTAGSGVAGNSGNGYSTLYANTHRNVNLFEVVFLSFRMAMEALFRPKGIVPCNTPYFAGPKYGTIRVQVPSPPISPDTASRFDMDGMH